MLAAPSSAGAVTAEAGLAAEGMTLAEWTAGPTLTVVELDTELVVVESFMLVVMTGLRRVDSLAARCLMSRGRNKRAMVSRQKQEYQRQSRDVNNTRQGSRSQAQVQSSKVGQSGVKHRDSRMNRRTLRNVTRGKQDFALGECLCAAFM